MFTFSRDTRRALAITSCICISLVVLFGCESRSQMTGLPTVANTVGSGEPSAIDTPTVVPTATTVATVAPMLEPTPTATPQPTITPTPEPTATKTPEPTPSPTPGPLTPAQIFGRVAPAIAFIQTDVATGSGVLIDGGYVLTNAHVVWPYNTARVVFDNGQEFRNVPVVAQDVVTDLAILGPVSPIAAALHLADGENLPIGTETYLIGYPAETEAFPQPTITRGLISRVREWEPAGVTYFQTDATIGSGQSGGALVNDNGEVIGISGIVNYDGNFAVVASAADISPVVDRLIVDKGSSERDRRIRYDQGRYRVEASLRTYWSQGVYAINEPAGTQIDFELSSNADGGISVRDSYGWELLSVNDSVGDAEHGSFVVEYGAPYFLIAWVDSQVSADFSLTSNHRLIPVQDPDDGVVLEIDKSYHGNIDFPGDTDYLHVNLQRGERVSIGASSTLLDMYLTIAFIGAEDHEVVVDDNSGLGFFGADANIVFEAPFTGSYFVVVQDYNGLAPGGYVLDLQPAARSDPLTTTTWGTYSNFADEERDFGAEHLVQTLSELPRSFQHVDSVETESSMDAIGLGGLYSALEIRVSENPFEMVMVAYNTLAENEIGLFDLSVANQDVDDITREFLYGAESWTQNVVVHDTRLLQVDRIGDLTFGSTIDATMDGLETTMDSIVFRRGYLVGYAWTYVATGENPIVSAEEIAIMLDTTMQEFIFAK